MAFIVSSGYIGPIRISCKMSHQGQCQLYYKIYGAIHNVICEWFPCLSDSIASILTVKLLQLPSTYRHMCDSVSFSQLLKSYFNILHRRKKNIQRKISRDDCHQVSLLVGFLRLFKILLEIKLRWWWCYEQRLWKYCAQLSVHNW